MLKVEGKRSASGVSWVAPGRAPIHMQSARGGVYLHQSEEADRE